MVTFAPKNINRVVMCDDCDSKKCNFFIFVSHLPPRGKCNIFIVKLPFLPSQSSHCQKKAPENHGIFTHKYHSNTLKVWYLQATTIVFVN